MDPAAASPPVSSSRAFARPPVTCGVCSDPGHSFGRLESTKPDRSPNSAADEVVQLHRGAGAGPPMNTVADNDANVGASNATEAWLASPHANNALGNYVGPLNNVQQTMGWQELQANGNTAKGAWVRFHLINSVIGGASTGDNLVPASGVVNTSANWRRWEDTAKWLHQHGGVYMEVDVTYGHGANVGFGPFPTNIQGYVPSRIDGEIYVPDTVHNCYQDNPGNGNGIFGINNWGNPTNYSVSVANPLPPVNPGEIDLAIKNVAWLRMHVYVGLSAEGARDIVDALNNNHQGMMSDWKDVNLNQCNTNTVSDILNTVETWGQMAGATDITLNAWNSILNGLWTLP